MTRPLFDDFVGPDGTVLNGRTTPSGHVMAVRYLGNDNAPTIQGNRYNSPVGAASYYYGTLANGTKVARMEFRFILSASGTNPLLAMLINKASSPLLAEFIHFTLGPTAWTLSTLQGDLNGGTGLWEHRGAGITQSILTTGVEYTWVAWVVGDYVILEIPGVVGPIAYQSPRIAACQGDRATFEIINYSTAPPGIKAEGTLVLAQPFGANRRPPPISYGKGSNLIPRPAAIFDADAISWTAGSNVAANYPSRSKLESANGRGSMVIRSAAAGFVSVLSPMVDLPGDDRWYSAHFAHKAGFAPLSSEQVRLRLSYYAADGTTLLRTNFSSYTRPFAGEWRPNALHLYAQTGCRKAQATIEWGDASAAGRDLLIDKVGLVEGLTGLWVPPA